MSRTWILTALGKDRPGIVAGVTKLLFELGCNLEDSAMTRLGGEFAVMVVFTAPARLRAAYLERACTALGRRLTLTVHLKALSNAELTRATHGQPYRISVYGADRPGIVYRVSQLLAQLRINITDVSTHRSSSSAGRARRPLYLMLLEVELPRRVTARRLERRLRVLAKSLGVSVNLRSADAQVL